MFNNSTKKHSFGKSGYRKEIHPFKETEKFINRNYRLWENPRFLIWQPFWPWMTFITSWDRVSHVFSILEDKSRQDQHFDTKLVVFNELWAFFLVNFFTPHPIIPQYMCASGVRFPDLWVDSLTTPNVKLTMSQSGGTSFW